MRIDVWLAENGFAPSRQKAQELIAAGRVFQTDPSGRRLKISKSSAVVDPALSLQIDVIPDPELGDQQFVSRGALKLKGAIEKTGVSLAGACVLDVGISTGGFADYCLQSGAARVVGIDVGHDQLAKRLREDTRVTLFEGVNARELDSDEWRKTLLGANAGGTFDLIVVDVSFISLRLVLPALPSYLAPQGKILALVKPQFEVGKQGLGKGGIVKDVSLYPQVEVTIRDLSASLGLKVESYFESSILGTDGNREFFAFLTQSQLGLL
jgi:23S rRNA (cytidine1920-2'-O)/16S rRNA (cytidine1409-2'-O)-methyltransferase